MAKQSRLHIRIVGVPGARAFQVMVEMRDGTRLNTFVFLPGSGGPRWPVILHRTPYGIAAADARDKTDCTRGWLPSVEEPLRGSILRGWRNIPDSRRPYITPEFTVDLEYNARAYRGSL